MSFKYSRYVARVARHPWCILPEKLEVIAETIRVPMTVARTVAAQHGAALEATGIGLMDVHWEREEAEALVALALEPESLAGLLPAGAQP